MLKKFILVLSLLIIPYMAESSEFGSIDSETRFQELYDSAVATIQQSHETRDKWTGRAVAGRSDADKKWAAEVEAILSDNSDTDWLAKAEKL